MFLRSMINLVRQYLYVKIEVKQFLSLRCFDLASVIILLRNLTKFQFVDKLVQNFKFGNCK